MRSFSIFEAISWKFCSESKLRLTKRGSNYAVHLPTRNFNADCPEPARYRAPKHQVRLYVSRESFECTRDYFYGWIYKKIWMHLLRNIFMIVPNTYRFPLHLSTSVRSYVNGWTMTRNGGGKQLGYIVRVLVEKMYLACIAATSSTLRIRMGTAPYECVSCRDSYVFQINTYERIKGFQQICWVLKRNSEEVQCDDGKSIRFCSLSLNVLETYGKNVGKLHRYILAGGEDTSCDGRMMKGGLLNGWAFAKMMQWKFREWVFSAGDNAAGAYVISASWSRFGNSAVFFWGIWIWI